MAKKKVSTTKKNGKKSEVLEEWGDKIERAKWLNGNIPRLEDTLKKLREIRAPKVIIDNQVRLIKKYKAEFKALDEYLKKRDAAMKSLLRAIFVEGED